MSNFFFVVRKSLKLADNYYFTVYIFQSEEITALSRLKLSIIVAILHNPVVTKFTHSRRLQARCPCKYLRTFATTTALAYLTSTKTCSSECVQAQCCATVLELHHLPFNEVRHALQTWCTTSALFFYRKVMVLYSGSQLFLFHMVASRILLHYARCVAVTRGQHEIRRVRTDALEACE